MVRSRSVRLVSHSSIIRPVILYFQFQYQRISRVVGYNSLEKPSVHDLVTCVDVFQMAFADNCSYNVLTKASIHLLNQRLQKPVTASNFRPNIVVEGCPAFAEVRRFAL